MRNSNNVTFDSKRSKELVERLDNLLADYSIFYMNTRGFHWNIKGDLFFELHVKFEELYKHLSKRIDQIAERISSLGLTPTHSYSDYLNISEIPEIRNVSDTHEAVTEVSKALKLLIIKQREIVMLAKDINDEATATLLSNYMIQQEKLVWMYTSFLGNGSQHTTKNKRRAEMIA